MDSFEKARIVNEASTETVHGRRRLSRKDKDLGTASNLVSMFRALRFGTFLALVFSPFASAFVASPAIAAPPAEAHAPHAPIFIPTDASFSPENGVTSGSGTPSDPFIIEGWEIDAATGNGIEVRGTTADFVIRNVFVHSGGIGHVGILLADVDNATVEDTLVRTSIYGIVVSGRDIVVMNNTLEDNDRGIQISGDASTIEVVANHVVRGGRGISLSGSRFARVHGNVIELTQWGGVVAGGGAANSLIDGNLLLGAGTGIELGDSLLGGASDLVIESNEIIASTYGILAFSSPRVTIRNNTIHGSRSAGINYHDSTDLVIRDNSIVSADGEAVYLEGMRRVTIEANSLLLNLYGMYLYFSGDARIVGNNVLFNTYPLGLTNPFNVTWADPYPEGGNFWSDYRGSDLCRGPTQSDCSGGDGIGDTPLEANFDTIDPRPLMAPTTSVIRYSLWGDAADGWGLRPQDIRAPGPTLVAAEGTGVSVTARANDSLIHNWYIDYDNDFVIDADEPSSPAFRANAGIVWNFTADRAGTFTYKCRFHPLTMTGEIQIRLPSLGPDMPPVAAFTVTPTVGNLTTTFQVDASASSDAHDPPSALQVRWDWEGDGVFDTEWNGTKVAQHLYGEAGSFAITLEVIDTRGFTDHVSHDILVDATPPLTAISLEGTLGLDGWYRTRILVSFLAMDDAPSLPRRRYRLDGNAWQDFLNPIEVGDGAHTIDYYSIDGVGHVESTKFVTVRVDTQPPEFESSDPSGTVTSSPVFISWTASDATSGIDHFEVSVDGGPFEPLGGHASLIAGLADGAHTVQVKAVDRAGHNVTATIQFAVDTNIFSFTGPHAGAPTVALTLAALAAVFVAWWRRWRGREPPASPPPNA